MVDSTGNIDPPQAPEPPAEKQPGFFSTRNGKIVIGAIGLFLVLLIAGGAVAFFLINGLLNQAASPTAVTTTKSTTVSGAATGTANASATASAPIVNPPEKPLSSTFTFRNVFAPSVSPVYPASASSSSTSTSSSSSSSTSTTSIPTEKNTLFLMSISTVNGEKQATFAWNGVLYTVGEGDQVDDSPWKVVSIGTNSVVMLFGDTQVTLTVGQGQSK